MQAPKEIAENQIADFTMNRFVDRKIESILRHLIINIPI